MIQHNIHFHKSHNDAENVVVAIKSSLPIWTNIEDLGEFEGVLVVHGEIARHEDQHTSLNRTLLNILIVDSIGDCLEAEGLNFFADLFETFVESAVVSHVAEVIVEVDEVSSVLHDSSVVGFKELFGQGLHLVVLIHTLIILKQLISTITKYILIFNQVQFTDLFEILCDTSPSPPPSANYCPLPITALSATTRSPTLVFKLYLLHIHEPFQTNNILFCSFPATRQGGDYVMRLEVFESRKWEFEILVPWKIRLSSSYQREATGPHTNFYTLFSFFCIFLIIFHYLSFLFPYLLPSPLSSSISPSTSPPTSHISPDKDMLPFYDAKLAPKRYSDFAMNLGLEAQQRLHEEWVQDFFHWLCCCLEMQFWWVFCFSWQPWYLSVIYLRVKYTGRRRIS